MSDGPSGGAGPVGPRGPSPLRLWASIDPGLSRWQWLVKWFLAIPHVIVLVFLWIAFTILTVVAGVAILFTGRYPRGIFTFNVGVLRWTWRVTAYAFGLLVTDRYPPFSLRDADYPAGLDLVYPERLSRGLVLVKWWLLAIPHYLILAFLIGGPWGGGGWWAEGGSWGAKSGGGGGGGGGLLGILVFIAVIGLLFTGRYLPGLFTLIVGLQRWVHRVVVYAALMTDAYPPFRLDQGGQDPPPPPTRVPVP